MSPEIAAACIGAGGLILAALSERIHFTLRRVEKKIDGLRNGTRSQALEAIAELQREREERRLAGLPLRRHVDRLVSPPAPHPEAE